MDLTFRSWMYTVFVFYYKCLVRLETVVLMPCTLKMETAGCSETTLPVIRTAGHHVAEDHFRNLKL
jgi:hypothetical protein